MHGRVGALRHFTGGATNEKAYIAVDGKGTKAGAATAVETVYTALEEGVYKVTL